MRYVTRSSEIRVPEDISIGVDFKFGEYTLRLSTDGELIWLSNSGGEGMELGPAEIERMLDDYFVENF